MMGTSHATSGALGWIAIVPWVAGATAAVTFDTPAILAGTLACAGAALLPDLDHPQSTVAYSLGPFTHVIAKGVNLLAGGHRQATHSLLFAVFMGVVTQIAVTLSNVAAILIMWFLTALALRSLGLVPPKTSHNIKGLVIAVEATAVVWAMTYFMPGQWLWLGFAVGLGCLLHLFGDCLTPEGVPFFWPHKWRGSIPIISRTGNFLEVGIITPIMGLATLWFLWQQLNAANINWPWS